MSDADRGRGQGGRTRGSRSRARGPRRATSLETLDERRYYRIGDVSRVTGVKPHVLRYWESEFRWMAPAKSRSKQRLYRKRDIEVIDLIRRLLYEERYTIAGARRRLRELGLARALEGGEAEAATDGAAALGAQRAVALAPAPSPGASATPANVVPLAPGFAAASVESAGPGGAGAAGGGAVGRSGAPQREDTAAVRDALRRIRDELVALRAAL